MFKFTDRILLIVSCFVVTNVFAADTQKCRKNSPYFYVALAEASYKKKPKDAQKSLNELLGTGNATIKKTYEFSEFGKTNFILVQDKHGNLHVAIEGSSDVENWIGNLIVYPINGIFQDNDVPQYVLKGMHRIIRGWKHTYGPIVTISGHSQGGMFASQLANYKKDKYKNTQIVTFNAFKPKKHGNQMHFAIKTEHASTLCTPSGRYIPINKGGAHWKLVSNHKMKYFLAGLKNKTWNDVL